MASATTLRTSTNPAAPAADGRHVSTGRAGRGTRGDDRHDDHEQKKTAAYRPEHVQPGQRETDNARRAERQTDQPGHMAKNILLAGIRLLMYLSVCFWYLSWQLCRVLVGKSRHSECL